MPASIHLVVTEGSLGTDAWRALWADARDAGPRRANAQALVWLRYAARARLDGRNLELSPAQLSRLLGRLDTVA